MPKIVKICLVLSFILGLTCPCHAFTFPWEKLKPELNLLKADVAKQADAVVKAQVDIGKSMTHFADLSARVGNIETSINSKIDAKIAAYDKSQTTNNNIGGNQTNQQTNDTAMLTNLNNIFKIIILALLAQMIALVKFTATMYQKIIDKMQAEQTRILVSKDDKDSKLDAFQNSLIAKAFDNATAEQFKKDVEAKKIEKEGVKING